MAVVQGSDLALAWKQDMVLYQQYHGSQDSPDPAGKDVWGRLGLAGAG